jgi:tRNA threonylcarbamoyladenosine biosynthesis protein TsaB
MVLGIESSTGRCGIGLVREEEVVGECTLGGEGATSDRLHLLIQQLSDGLRVRVEEIGGIAVSIGPGSFTGLRVGLSAAKGLAFALSKPLVGVSSLAAMAWDVPLAAWPVAPALDARKGEIYTGLYSTEDGTPRELGPPLAIRPDEVPDDYRDRPIIFLGTGAALYRDVLARTCGPKARFLLPGRAWPRPAAIAFLGASRLLRGEVDDMASLVPTYLRPSEAELAGQDRSDHI